MLVGLSNATIQAFRDAEDGGSDDESRQDLDMYSGVIHDLFQFYTPSIDRGLLLLAIRQGSPVPLSHAQICKLPHRRTEPVSIPGAPTCWRSVQINIGTWVTSLTYLSETPQTPTPNPLLMPDKLLSRFARIQMDSGTEEPFNEQTALFMDN
ncbi:hypothetical protein JMJ35_009297 [Cladonia borealis]|uniref:Uncharacterized protein n=1 Tax=Cladonia borealis TaxID=184061 RepID=A0AA39UY01_9LECA|nr:hypothetical protein JMJ35_009297 [Cladonia borealis]